MTKKDYELIAENIKTCVNRVKNTRNDADQIINSIFYGLVANLAQDLEQENPRFNPIKFMEACGIKAV